MLNYEDVVIRMPQSFSQIQYVIGDTAVVAKMKHSPAFPLFDDQVIDYLDTVSNSLLQSADAKLYPDVITFAFWCRKASVKSLKKPYSDITNRIGRGVAFHISPSNVAVNFAYSLVTGLLSGNSNIVRLPSKTFPQVGIICSALAQALDENIKPYICLLQYGHEQQITDYFSGICDTRIIWGGDQTIFTIRQSPIKARATEITFADRYSFCVINADAYLISQKQKNIAQAFFNDTYLTDQNACTSSRLVVWLGERVQEAQSIFWSNLHELVQERYALQPVQAISKYLAFCKHAASNSFVHLEPNTDNLIFRVKLDKLAETDVDYIFNSGYFIEYAASSLDDLLPLCSTSCQTLSYFGLEKTVLEQFVMTARPRGIDRIVPIGKTMDFSLVWDGYDLIRSLSREIEIT